MKQQMGIPAARVLHSSVAPNSCLHVKSEGVVQDNTSILSAMSDLHNAHTRIHGICIIHIVLLTKWHLFCSSIKPELDLGPERLQSRAKTKFKAKSIL